MKLKFRAWSNGEQIYTYSDDFKSDIPYMGISMFFDYSDIDCLEQFINKEWVIIND